MDSQDNKRRWLLWLSTIPFGFLGNLLVFGVAHLIDSGGMEPVIKTFQEFDAWVFILIVTALGLLTGGIVKISVDYRKTKRWYYGLGYTIATIAVLIFLCISIRSARLEAKRTAAENPIDNAVVLPSEKVKELMEHGVTDSVSLSVFGEMQPVLRQLETELKDTAFDFKGSETEPTGEVLMNGTRQKVYTVYYNLDAKSSLFASVFIDTEEGFKTLAHRTRVPNDKLDEATREMLIFKSKKQ